MGKNSIPNNNKNKTDRCTYPVWMYIVSTVAVCVFIVLFLVLIYLLNIIVSNKMIQGDNLLNGLVNFATLLSIFLSISSICFALYTSMQTSRQYDSMSRAVTEIRETNNFIAKNNSSLLGYVHEISKEIAHLDGKFDMRINNKQIDDKKLTGNKDIPNNNQS